jgi:hypothetical protein
MLSGSGLGCTNKVNTGKYRVKKEILILYSRNFDLETCRNNCIESLQINITHTSLVPCLLPSDFRVLAKLYYHCSQKQGYMHRTNFSDWGEEGKTLKVSSCTNSIFCCVLQLAATIAGRRHREN